MCFLILVLKEVGANVALILHRSKMLFLQLVIQKELFKNKNITCFEVK